MNTSTPLEKRPLIKWTIIIAAVVTGIYMAAFMAIYAGRGYDLTTWTIVVGIVYGTMHGVGMWAILTLVVHLVGRLFPDK